MNEFYPGQTVRFGEVPVTIRSVYGLEDGQVGYVVENVDGSAFRVLHDRLRPVAAITQIAVDKSLPFEVVCSRAALHWNRQTERRI